ncbi:putative EG45-like domain containing protein 1 [Nymphaea thermarum]|nr:putative EG45-like domain containing protein 1 [Nymphaea thermarum]
MEVCFGRDLMWVRDDAATQCWGYDQSRFPANNMFVSAGEMVWDNGAACGRRYRVRCIGGSGRPCVGGFVDVTVVDACNTFPCPSTFLFSADAFQQISRNPHAAVSVEFWHSLLYEHLQDLSF